MRATVCWATIICSCSQQWCRLTLSILLLQKRTLMLKECKARWQGWGHTQSDRCDLGTKENTYLTPLATWEFIFLFTWCPKLLLLLPQPHNCFFSFFFAFYLSPLTFESRFDPYLSCLLLSLVSQIYSWGFNHHLSTCSFQPCSSQLTSCSWSPFHLQTISDT